MSRSEILATMSTAGLRYERKARLLMTTDKYAVNDRMKEYQADYADRISDELDRRNAADQARAIEHDDEPDLCPECGSTTFNRQEDYTDYHGCRLSLGPVWRCTDCKWGVRAL